MQQQQKCTCILVVDGDAGVRLAAGELLREAGYSVVEAENGDQALERFDAEQPALVLIDMALPVMSACRLCEALRGRSAAADLPILVMIGADDRVSIDEAYRSGATDFVTKPVVWPLLRHRVAYALRTSQTMQALRAKEVLVASAQRIAQLGSWVWYPGLERIERSAEYYRIFGQPAEAFGEAPTAVIEHVDAPDQSKLRTVLCEALQRGRPYGIDFRIQRPSGEMRRLYEQVEVVRNNAGEVEQIQAITQDITDRVEAEARIRSLAYYDNLTGLANRTLFREMMAYALQQADRLDLQCAVLFVDLDRFKRINESLGNDGGDAILRVIGERLEACLRSADLKGVNRSSTPEQAVARLAGDEFTLFLFDVGLPAMTAQIARRMREALAQPIAVAGKEVTVSASIGVALFPQDGNDTELLLKHAETAMFVAKDGGRNKVCFYNRAMSTSVQSKLALEGDLRLALSRKEFRLHYQPKVDLSSGRIVGAEALIRWQHPERGMVGPSEFIPVAEECGLIVGITDWLVSETCGQIRAWKDAGVPVVPVSINLSGVSFRQHGLTESLFDALSASGVEPSLLQCEVTESVLMQDLDRSVLTLSVIREMGIGLAVDDFGTGYSSLSYLKRFPVDTLKVDGAFVAEVARHADDAAIAGAIIAMGQNLRLLVIAEGVETVEQAQFLLSRGCTVSQGYLFARPIAAEDFVDLLSKGIRMPDGLVAASSA